MQVEFAKDMAGVVDRGLTIPRVVDGEWRYAIEMYTDPMLSLPKERFQRVLAHELGHTPQFEYGTIGANAKDFLSLESSVQKIWDELCTFADRKPTESPLTAEAFALTSYLPLISHDPTQNRAYFAKRDEFRELLKKRESMIKGYEEKMRGSTMLREGFASWVSDQVSQELGYAEDTNYAPSCAVDSPYRDGLARLKNLPLPEALTIGLTKGSDRGLVAATTQSRWSLFGR